MLRATLKRNLLPIALITLGGLIFLTLILYLFRAYLPMLGWVLFGLLMIGAGVLGLVVTNPKNRTRAGDKSPEASSASGATPPTTSPAYTTTTARRGTSGSGLQRPLAISRPALIGGGVFLVTLTLLLLCNLGMALRSLLTVHQTQIVDCREAARYAEDGWHFVSAYSYSFEDAVSGHTERTDCVMEQTRFVWTRDKRAPKDKASIDDASEDDASWNDATNEGAIVPFAPTPDLAPPQIYDPPSTQMPLPTLTPWPVNSPLPTSTPPAAVEPTDTPLPALIELTDTPAHSAFTATPIPRTDIAVCDMIMEDTFLDTYVQWEGLIITRPTRIDEAQWFEVEWTNMDLDSACNQAIFFVSYDGAARFLEKDTILVTGTIIDTNYEYVGASGQTEYTVVVSSDAVELLD